MTKFKVLVTNRASNRVGDRMQMTRIKPRAVLAAGAALVCLAVQVRAEDAATLAAMPQWLIIS